MKISTGGRCPKRPNNNPSPFIPVPAPCPRLHHPLVSLKQACIHCYCGIYRAPAEAAKASSPNQAYSGISLGYAVLQSFIHTLNACMFWAGSCRAAIYETTQRIFAGGNHPLVLLKQACIHCYCGIYRGSCRAAIMKRHSLTLCFAKASPAPPFRHTQPATAPCPRLHSPPGRYG